MTLWETPSRIEARDEIALPTRVTMLSFLVIIKKKSKERKNICHFIKGPRVLYFVKSLSYAY